MPNDFKVGHITHRLHEQRERLHENIALRKRMLENTYLNQMRVEKHHLIDRITRLQPGPQKVLLKQRLAKLNAQLGN